MTINSSSEQSLLKSMSLKSRTNYWIGATDEKKEGKWKWITGEKWSYTAWGKNQPDNSQMSTGVDEDYLQVCVDWGYTWNDSANKQDSTAGIGFICEWEKDTRLSDEIQKVKADYKNQQKTFDNAERGVINQIKENYDTLKENREKAVHDIIEKSIALDARLSKAEKQALVDTLMEEILKTIDTSPTTFKKCKTGADLVNAVANQLMDENNEFTFKSGKTTFIVKCKTTGIWGATLTIGSIRKNNSAATYTFGYTTTSKTKIKGSMDALKELAESKIDEAWDAVLSDAGEILQISEIKTFFKQVKKDKMFAALKALDPSLEEDLENATSVISKYKKVVDSYEKVTSVDLDSASEDQIMNKIENYTKNVEAFVEAVADL